MHFEHYDNERLKAQLSGERFTVTYELTGTEAECRTIANEICVEQSIEFPVAATPAGDIIDQIVGRIEEFTQTAENTWRADISFAVENTAGEFTQFLNVLMGNFSIK
ncbi:MAG: ribulose 1,5-bisphosphate carboxylase large subunit, partial [Lachnospiraceae bacterium]|nr:ribulose 1,5-bisphosphate carboxylase large subunit [Lachnospiraceae bacterium]